MRSLPDGLTGAVMAVESISDAAVLLHGPGGCRVRHMVYSSESFSRLDMGDYSGDFFYGYPRVPATYLDEYDYIHGASFKVGEAISEIDGHSPALTVIIDSPGASLIGDDHRGFNRAFPGTSVVLPLDEAMASLPASMVYDRTMETIMESIHTAKGRTIKGSVNILGLSIMDRDWRAALGEATAALEGMGLRVLSAPGAGSSVEELRWSVNAEYNVVVCPEYCRRLVDFYEVMGVKTIRPVDGAPVGLDATESWLDEVASLTGRNPLRVKRKIHTCREHVHSRLVASMFDTMKLKGMTFSVAADASVARPLTEWLVEYLGMAPVAIATDPGSDPEEERLLERFLSNLGFSDAFGKEPEDGSDVILCEGIVASTMELNGSCGIGIPIGRSSMDPPGIVPRPIYGLQGSLYILDSIVRGSRLL